MFYILGGFLIAASAGVAQQASSIEPCAQISASLSSYSAANPSATSSLRLPYDTARACGLSVPIIADDAIPLIEGIQAMVEFQSDLAFKAEPPAGYLIAPIDITQELENLKSAVDSGEITQELEFQTRLVTIFAQAHDGHLNFRPDGLPLLRSARDFGSLVSLSMDGIEVPKLYFYNEIIAWLQNQSGEPSAITQINGQPAPDFILQQQLNSTYGGFQDPDALYNVYLVALNNGDVGTSNWGGLFPGYSLSDAGPTTSLEFENGTQIERENYVWTSANFSNVVDGESFYNAFLNYTVNNEVLASSAAARSSATATTTGTATSSAASATATSGSSLQIASYPAPIVISEDGTASGYFLNETGFEDVAVLALRSMSLHYPASFQSTVTEFLNRCRSEQKQRLIIDLSGNPGGTLLLGYDVFKQLFPSLNPYGAANLRASESFRLLGEVVTPLAQSELEQDSDNLTVVTTSNFAAGSYLNVSGQRFENFEDMYGPVTTGPGPDNYTNLQKLDLSTPELNDAIGSIVVSGYANNTDIAPQPFSNENIIILSDGRCGSTCTTLAHFLKYQAKVKSIAMGGRPTTNNNTAMQAIGGIKGSQLLPLSILHTIIDAVYDTLDEPTINSWTNTSVGTLHNYAGYVSLRTESFGRKAEDVTFNFRNNIAETDPVSDPVPLQFVYEAADCRMWYTPPHIADISYLWLDVAANGFGLNGTGVFERCVLGSTGHPSSLSGDDSLFDGGRLSNGTGTRTDRQSDGDSNADSATNGVSRIGIGSSVFAMLSTVFLVLIVEILG